MRKVNNLSPWWTFPIHFCWGVWYRYPLCCVWYYTKEVAKDIALIAKVAFERRTGKEFGILKREYKNVGYVQCDRCWEKNNGST